MRTTRKFCHTASVLLASVFAAVAVAAAPPPEVVAEIDHLLAFVEGSECVFLRNGDAHEPADAAKHIRRKYDHFKKKIDTTDDFIKRSATGSLMSGKPYQVKCPPGDEVQLTAEWLRAELARYRDRTPSLQ
ncbi:MAG: DUF5329 domain-containing protein [Pseudomonadota bacterium]